MIGCNISKCTLFIFFRPFLILFCLFIRFPSFINQIILCISIIVIIDLLCPVEIFTLIMKSYCYEEEGICLLPFGSIRAIDNWKHPTYELEFCWSTDR